MAILAHDLRNPIAAIQAGLRALDRQNDDPDRRHLVKLMDGITRRMTGLVNNLLDHARNRLGGGIVLDRSDAPLAEVLDQIITELRAVDPSRNIVASFALPPNLNCDPARIAQLLSNLLGNAITHGAPDRPIYVTARVMNGIFELAVQNEGIPISDALLPNLFDPFRKGEGQRAGVGLGLGLYIAAEIAKAHGGSISVASVIEKTVFTFEMPVSLRESAETGTALGTVPQDLPASQLVK